MMVRRSLTSMFSGIVLASTVVLVAQNMALRPADPSVVAVSANKLDEYAGQYRAALRLTRWLRCRFDIPVRNVIGHNESLQSPYFRELVPAFRGQTHSDFNRHDMNIVRAAVARLGC